MDTMMDQKYVILKEYVIQELRTHQEAINTGDMTSLSPLYRFLFQSMTKNHVRLNNIKFIFDVLEGIKHPDHDALRRVEFLKFIPEHDTFHLFQEKCCELARSIAPLVKSQRMYFHHLRFTSASDTYVTSSTVGVLDRYLPYPKTNQLCNQKVIDFFLLVFRDILRMDVLHALNFGQCHSMSDAQKKIEQVERIVTFGTIDLCNAYSNDRLLMLDRDRFNRSWERDALRSILVTPFDNDVCSVNILLEGTPSVSFWHNVSHWVFDFTDDRHFLYNMCMVLKNIFFFEKLAIDQINSFMIQNDVDILVDADSK